MVETILNRRDRLNTIMKEIFEKKLFTSYLKKWINKDESVTHRNEIAH